MILLIAPPLPLMLLLLVPSWQHLSSVLFSN
jgi:hypothetical protein